MKKIYNYIMLFILAFVAVCCSEEEPIQTPSKSGGEVQFGLSLENLSRTIYGKESNNAFPIYWVNDDKVMVYSPQCATGRNLAEYKVSVNSTQQNYATSLTKTGSYGIQWGDEVANFYSVYPSGDYTVSGEKIQNLKIGYSQDVYLAEDGVTLKNMSDCLMHAVVNNVAVGTTVNLTYNPIATAIMLHLNVPSSSTVGFTIQSIKLTAPTGTNIAGDFHVNLAYGTFAEWVTGSSSNSITLQISNSATGGFYQMAKGSSIIVPIFLVPVDGLDISGWTIDIITDQGTFKKTLTRTDDGKTALKAGMVHNLTLPNLTIEKETEWQVANWMVNIPRNVYLSEISIPGSWNSLNKDFQGDNPSIASQYAAGVRAFHLDTRWSTTANESWWLATNDYDVDDLNSENMYLSVADGATSKKVGTGRSSGYQGRIMQQGNTDFVTYLSQITDNVKSDEYMVLFCSFAQDSYNDVAKTGKTWMQAISDACSANNAVFDAQKINTNTVVGDVLGSVIVIVNCENAIENEDLPNNSKCMFVHVPNNLTKDYFPTEGFKTDSLHTSSSTSPISMAVSQAQITSSTGSAIADGTRGYYPSFTERTSVVNAILDWSKENYGTTNYAHDKWIYLGLGGNTASRASSTGDDDTAYDVMAVYSPLINSRIAAMGNGAPYYPIGIVYMNYTTIQSHIVDGTTIYPKETVENILMLNNKYRLQYDPDKPANYNPNAKAISEYDTSLTTGGQVFSLD